jgi:hypothetical protein
MILKDLQESRVLGMRLRRRGGWKYAGWKTRALVSVCSRKLELTGHEAIKASVSSQRN